MPLNTKVSGVWKDITSVHVNVADSWKTVIAAWTKVSGVWQQVYAALTATVTGVLVKSGLIASPPDPSDLNVTASLAITGTGPFTYLWQWTGVPSYTSSITGANFTLGISSGSDFSASGDVWCTVTDANGNSITTEARPWSLILSTL